MMKDIMEQAQPYIISIVTALIGILATIITGSIKKAQGKAEAYYNAHTNEKDRELLHKIGMEAFSWAQTVYREYEGDRKLQEAYSYASEKLANLGVEMSGDEIRAAIEKAVVDYNAKKAGGKIAS
ncbi:phage holin [Paenibacillus sp. UASWS1643]|uniref:phage holin n=1 Tax=Paenibacillus sp. UASWS1643 TaxID=2580422 RepID=UPI00123A52CA|nr:phage holin [Paenibacillus sp. UASWS1643]KAA8747094.1 phage holin [Paenibacillus sp. UASWS1643]